MTAPRSRRVPPAEKPGHRAPLATAPTAGRRILLFALALGLLAAVPYLHGIGNSFIELDDPGYVTKNMHVLQGLTRDGVGWALTTFHLANWHPLTWLSHMADVSLFGVDPRGHHLVNILLHALNTALLFLALFRLTASLGPSAFTAALFGVHPLHVESVAWVSERKDLLSGLFFMLILLAYERYVRRGKGVRLLAVGLLLALGLTAKPMLVTVPFVLLLLDVWPLGRTSWAPPADGGEWAPEPWRRLLLEKAPLFAPSLASSVVTFLAQREAGAVVKIEAIPAVMRLANALVSYAAYLGKAAWPSGLVVLYPYPMQWYPISKVLVSVLILAALTWAVFSRFRRAPFLAVAWLWFVGMLVPVIGLVQVGNQAMADRYTYLPLVGVFIAVAWGIPRMFPDGPRRAVSLGACACTAIVLLSAASWVQVGWWKDSEMLFERTLSLTTGNWLIEYNLGTTLAERGNLEDAMARFRAALRIDPDLPEVHNNLGNALLSEGKFDEGMIHIREALRLRPDYPEAHNNLGTALRDLGRLDEAIVHFREAIRLRPDLPEVRYNLGNTLLTRGELEEAIVQYREALRLRPDFPAVHNNLGTILLNRGNPEEAMVHFREALRLRPSFAGSHYNLGTILANRGSLDEAMVHFREALRLQPDYVEAHEALAAVLGQLGRSEEAHRHFEEARRLRGSVPPPGEKP